MRHYLRLPHSDNKSLKEWNAVDEYFLSFTDNFVIDKHSSFLIFGDRFGYLSYNLIKRGFSVFCFIEFKSQYDSIKHNTENKATTLFYGDKLPLVKNIFIKIPKSLALLDFYLSLIEEIKEAQINLTLGFMTKYFNKSIITLLKSYYNDIEQSKAWKKSRLIIAQGKKLSRKKNSIIQLKTHFGNLQQYKGVFSGDSIDIGTRYLLNRIQLKRNEQKVLDLGSGSGIIGKYLQEKFNISELHLIDDSYLAYLSGKLNIKKGNFHWDYSVSKFKDGQFDVVISNPPFHFGHEIDISIPMHLLIDSTRIITPGGRLIVVANNHINYKSILSGHFSKISFMNQNEKFYILEAIK